MRPAVTPERVEVPKSFLHVAAGSGFETHEFFRLSPAYFDLSVSRAVAWKIPHHVAVATIPALINFSTPMQRRALFASHKTATISIGRATWVLALPPNPSIKVGLALKTKFFQGAPDTAAVPPALQRFAVPKQDVALKVFAGPFHDATARDANITAQLVQGVLIGTAPEQYVLPADFVSCPFSLLSSRDADYQISFNKEVPLPQVLKHAQNIGGPVFVSRFGFLCGYGKCPANLPQARIHLKTKAAARATQPDSNKPKFSTMTVHRVDGKAMPPEEVKCVVEYSKIPIYKAVHVNAVVCSFWITAEAAKAFGDSRIIYGCWFVEIEEWSVRKVAGGGGSGAGGGGSGVGDDSSTRTGQDDPVAAE